MTAWTGFPPHPEQPGYHWIGSVASPFVARWSPATQTWSWVGGTWLVRTREGLRASVLDRIEDRWVYQGAIPRPINGSLSAPEPKPGQLWRSQASKTEDRTILSVDDLLVIYATARFPELRISRKGWRHWVRKCEARPVFCGSAAE